MLIVGSMVGAPVGTALAGPVAQHLGADVVLLGCAVIALLLTVPLLAVPATRRLHAGRDTPAHVPAGA